MALNGTLFDRTVGAPNRRARYMDALYFALLPELADAEAMVDIGWDVRRRAGVSAAPMMAELMHVSLIGLARAHGLPPELVQAGKLIGDRVSWPDFDLTFTRAATFGGGALVFQCSDGAGASVRGLHDQILTIMEDLDLWHGRRRPFDPHLTFAWGRQHMPARDLDEAIRWRARELVLVHSEQGRGRHHHLARWPLKRRDVH